MGKDDKKVTYLVGFDKVASDMKKKVKRLAEKKAISSFTMLGIARGNGVPKYSGGMVGDAQILVEGLYYMAKQREDVRAVIEIVANALKSNALQELTVVKDLHEKGVLSAMCANALEGAGIEDLTELKAKTRKEVGQIKNISKKALAELDKLMEERNWDYLTE